MYSTSAFGFGGGGRFDTPEKPSSVRRVGLSSDVKPGVPPPEPPCIAVTAAMVLHSAEKGALDSGNCNIYENVQCGVVSMVGWIVTESISAAEPHFDFSDGSTVFPLPCVVVDIQSDNEVWHRQQLIDTITRGALVRLIGIPAVNETKSPKIRVVHVRRATGADHAYYHTLEVIHNYVTTTGQLRCAATPADNDVLFDDDDKPTAVIELGVDNRENKTDNISVGVELPSSFDNITDVCSRHVVKFILDHRQPQVGVSISEINKNLSDKFLPSRIGSSVQALVDGGDAYETIHDQYDVIG